MCRSQKRRGTLLELPAGDEFLAPKLVFQPLKPESLPCLGPNEKCQSAKLTGNIIHR
jgi:hypothetical protein